MSTFVAIIKLKHQKYDFFCYIEAVKSSLQPVVFVPLPELLSHESLCMCWCSQTKTRPANASLSQLAALVLKLYLTRDELRIVAAVSLGSCKMPFHLSAVWIPPSDRSGRGIFCLAGHSWVAPTSSLTPPPPAPQLQFRLNSGYFHWGN